MRLWVKGIAFNTRTTRSTPIGPTFCKILWPPARVPLPVTASPPPGSGSIEFTSFPEPSTGSPRRSREKDAVELALCEIISQFHPFGAFHRIVPGSFLFLRQSLASRFGCYHGSFSWLRFEPAKLRMRGKDTLGGATHNRRLVPTSFDSALPEFLIKQASRIVPALWAKNPIGESQSQVFFLE